MNLATKPPLRSTSSVQQRWHAPMIALKSSGSSRAESAVEPTRSQNISVSWRRWAVSCEAGAAMTGGLGPGGRGSGRKLGNRTQHSAAISQCSDTKIFQVLIAEVAKD